MSSDESSTMYGNPLSEFVMFLMDFVVFVARSIYFLMETLILTITPDRYRKLKVSVASLSSSSSSSTHFCLQHISKILNEIVRLFVMFD